MPNPATPAFLDALAARLPPGTLRPPAPRHLAEPRGRWQGRAAAVVAPARVEEVAATIALAQAAGVGVIPWGGGTGLVGGQTAAEGPLPILLSTERMAAVRAVHPAENAIVAEAGATVAAVQAAAAAAGRLYPLSLASEGSATVGGTLATNAGGTGVLRYGNARDLCLGIEAVLADGTVWHGLKRLRKDNAGYDLRDLIVGSEGTLGVITAACLRLHPQPAARAVAMLAVRSPAAALELLHLAQGRLPGLVSAFELIGRTGWEFLAETMPDLRAPFAHPPEWCVLVDLGLPAGLDPLDTMAGLHAEAEARGLAGEAAVALSAAQADHLWRLREAIPEANRRIGAVANHDIALPLSEVAGFIAAAGAAVAALGPFRINCFGHLGDGNLHFNVFPPRGGTRADHAAARAAVVRTVHDMVHALGGSVSAEHGVGRLKVADLIRYGDPVKVAMMRAVKAALDPAGILNPGAVLG